MSTLTLKELIRKIIVEDVIDAAERFKSKQKNDFSKKITSLQGDIQNSFQTQDKQEREINSALEGIRDIPDEIIDQKQMRLAAPKAFDEDTGWGPNGSVYDVVRITHIGAEDYEQVRKFVVANIDKFRQCIAIMRHRLEEIERYADELEWPAPWRRYTRWNTYASEIQQFAYNVQRMIKTAQTAEKNKAERKR